MSLLFSALGAVCVSCETYNDPGVLDCSACGAGLGGALWAKQLAAAPAPAPPPAGATASAKPAPPAPPPAAEAPASLTFMGKAPSVSGEISKGPPVLQRTPGPFAGPHGTPGPAPHPTGKASPPGAAAPGEGAPTASPPKMSAPPPGFSPGPLAASPSPSPSPAPSPAGAQTIHGTPGPGQPPITSACPRCGKAYLPDTRFCANCGLKLGGAEAQRALTPRLNQGAAKLMLLRGMGASGTSFHLAEEQTQLGRTAGQIRFPSDDTLSSLAATFTYRGGRLYVRDEGGPSGVFVRLQLPAVLLPNDWFSIGDKLLRFLGRVPPPHPTSTQPRHLGSMRPGSGPLLRIQLVHLGGIGGRVFALPAPIRIGRALGEVLFGDDPFISTRHCELDVDPAGAVLRDLGSSNGTFVRIPPGTEREIGPGDTLRLGRNILRLDG